MYYIFVYPDIKVYNLRVLTIFLKIERRLTLRISHLEYYIMNDEIPHSYLLNNNGIIIIPWTWGGLGWTSKDLCNERVHFSATVRGVPGPLSGQRPSRWFTPPTSSPSTWYGGPLLTRPGLSSSALSFFFPYSGGCWPFRLCYGMRQGRLSWFSVTWRDISSSYLRRVDH